MSKRVSSEEIRASATELEKVADRLDDEFDAFLNRVSDIGPAAGEAEMVGQVVGSGLDEAEVVVIEAVESVVDGLHWFVEALRIMADTYEAAEDQNVQHVEEAWPGD